MTNLTCDALINPDYTPPSQEMVVLGIQHVLAEAARLANAGKFLF